MQRSKEIGRSVVLNGLRSAGAVWPNAVKVVGHLYRRFWETGVAGGSTESCKKLGNEGKGFANPMFAISSTPSGKFAVHYGTEPLLGFHLAETFRSLGHKLTLAAQSDKLVQAAKDQFNGWGRTFVHALGSQRVQIVLFSGDAVALCHELQLELGLGRQPEHASAYTRPWRLQALRLDGFVGSPDPRRAFVDLFDVVDTSNLGDHIGLINMITATALLLRPRTSSALYTESLLAVSNDATTALTAALGSDAATFSLLIGLAPSGLLNGTTLEGVPNEAMLEKLSGEGGSIRLQRQYRLRVHWKVADPVLRLKVEPDELAAWFSAMYKKMFAQEDISTLFSRVQRMKSAHYSTDMQWYTRAAIVALIQVVKLRIQTDWDRVMDKFLQLVETDRTLLVGSNSLQELNMHLALSGVWTLPLLAEGPRQIQSKFNLPLRPRANEDGILGQASPPPIVYLVVSTPRKSLKAFTEGNIDAMGSSGMHVSVKQQLGMSQYENCFFSFHCFFGRFRPSDQRDRPPVFEEDGEGWLGSADLVTVCAVPTWGLLMGPRNGIKVALALNTSPETLLRFRQKLGPLLIIFETPLENERRVSICQDPPLLDINSSIADRNQWLQVVPDHHKAQDAASAKFDAKHRVSKLQVRAPFAERSGQSTALAEGAPVTVTPVDLFTVDIKVGDTLARRITFPFPIHSDLSKTRVARKSSWIEVEAAIYLAPQKDIFETWTHVSSSSDGALTPNYIPRVDLDIQPMMKSTTPEDRTWLNIMVITGAMSVAEKQAQHPSNISSTNPKSDIKQSLSIMFASFMGFHSQANAPIRTFQLTLKRNQNSHALIFVKSLRHDLDLGSIVLDAYIMPFTKSRVQALSGAVQGLLAGSSKPPLGLYLTDEESVLWKRLLPALAERCRKWSHKEDCEYRTQGKIPLSVEANENPLCSCGEGKVPSDFAKDDREWAPFAKYVTRIAIAPIFPVPYVEATADFPEDLPAAERAGAGPWCDNCNKSSGQLQSCAACKKARYCSRECQKAAWKTHKLHCTR